MATERKLRVLLSPLLSFPVNILISSNILQALGSLLACHFPPFLGILFSLSSTGSRNMDIGEGKILCGDRVPPENFSLPQKLSYPGPYYFQLLL